MPEKLLYSKSESCVAFRNNLRSLTAPIGSGELAVVRSRRRVYISADDLRAFAKRGRPTLGSSHRQPDHPPDSHGSSEVTPELPAPVSSGTRKPEPLETKDQLTRVRASDRRREDLLWLRSQRAKAVGER
jgi:hypothetical protein